MKKHRKLKIILIIVLLPFMLYFGYFLFFADGFVALAHYNEFKVNADVPTYHGREYDEAQEFDCFYKSESRKLKIVSFRYSFPYFRYFYGDEYENPKYIIYKRYYVFFRKDLDYKSIKLELFYRVRESGKLTGDEVKVGNYSINDITGKETELKFGDFNENYSFVAYFDTSYNDFVEVYNMIDVYKEEDTYYIVYVNSERRTIYEVSTEFADLLNSL